MQELEQVDLAISCELANIGVQQSVVVPRVRLGQQGTIHLEQNEHVQMNVDVVFPKLERLIAEAQKVPIPFVILFCIVVEHPPQQRQVARREGKFYHALMSVEAVDTVPEIAIVWAWCELGRQA